MTEILEGNGYQRLLALMGRSSSPNTTQIRRGVIVSPPPNVSVRLDGDTIDIPGEGIILAEHLTDHKREWRLPGEGAYQEYEIKSNLSEGTPVICADDGQFVYILDKAVI